MNSERTEHRQGPGTGNRDENAPPSRITDWDEREAFVSKDLRAVGWLVLERLFTTEFEPGRASAAATVIRALTALGDSPADEDEQLGTIELHGMLMNGFQPRDDDEWALAERVFGQERMAEFRRWQGLPARETS